MNAANEFVRTLQTWLEGRTEQEIMALSAAGFAVVALLIVWAVWARSKRKKHIEEVPEEPSQQIEPAEELEQEATIEKSEKPLSEQEPIPPEEETPEEITQPEQEQVPEEPAIEPPTQEIAEAAPEIREIEEEPVAPEEVAEVAPPQPEPAVEEIEKPKVVAPPKEKPKPKSLKEGLSKTRKGFIAKLFAAIAGKKEIKDDLLEDIEEILFTADIGTRTAQDLLEAIYEKADKNELGDPERIISLLKEESLSRLVVDAPPVNWDAHKPFVLMMVGVNGTGKTTTIGKLARMFTNDGKKVVLAAADTFRAAAAEQLQVWAERSGCEFVRGAEGADPGSVVYNALNAAIARDADIVIVDTAGRLHTKFNLMEELKKVVRVAKKVIPDAPHETWLVLDANTGQNAIHQAREFSQAVDITGIVMTKLDGTAKGGIIIGISDELKLPVRYIGIGEAVEDLRPFDPKAFVDALFDRM